MKWVILCFLLFLTGCGQTEKTEVREPSAAVVRHGEELGNMGEDAVTIQRNLAQWYNLNLISEYDPDFRMAYGEILFFSDGVMGTLEIPEVGELAIYHDRSEKGVGHDPDSAFPIGGTGNHAVLWLPEDLTPEEGDVFTVHILGGTLSYEIIAVRKKWDLSSVPGVDYCSLIGGDGRQYLAVRIENVS